MKPQIKYTEERTKYVLHEDYTVDVGIQCADIEVDFIELKNGVLTIKKGFRWDGPSGPTFDTKSFMRGSLVHDVLYKLMKLDELMWELWKNYADELLITLCKEDGMPWWRRRYVKRAVRDFGRLYSNMHNENEVKTAP